MSWSQSQGRCLVSDEPVLTHFIAKAERGKSLLKHHSSDLSEDHFRIKWIAAQRCPLSPLTTKGLTPKCRYQHWRCSVLWTSSTEPHSSALKNFINHYGISVKNEIISADISLQMFPPADQQIGGQQKRTTALSHHHYTHSFSASVKAKEGLSQWKPSDKISKGASETPNSLLSFS